MGKLWAIFAVSVNTRKNKNRTANALLLSKYHCFREKSTSNRPPAAFFLKLPKMRGNFYGFRKQGRRRGPEIREFSENMANLLDKRRILATIESQTYNFIVPYQEWRRERPDEATATCFHKVPIPTETTDEERKTIFSRASMSEARVFCHPARDSKGERTWQEPTYLPLNP